MLSASVNVIKLFPVFAKVPSALYEINKVIPSKELISPVLGTLSDEPVASTTVAWPLVSKFTVPPAVILSALQNGVALIPMIFILPLITENLAIFNYNGLLGLEMAQPVAYLITAAITLPITVIFLSRLPKDGTEILK